MAATNHFDIVLVGSDLAGLTAAALLSHRGFRVLRLGTAEPSDTYTLGRYELPSAPTFFTGLESPAVRRITGALNLIQLVRRRLQPQRPCFQLVLPDARLDVGESVEQNQRELAREFDDASIAAFEAYLGRAQEIGRQLDAAVGQDHTLLPEGFFERREIARWEAKLAPSAEDLFVGLPEGHPLRAAAGLPAALGSSLAPWSPSVSTLARHDELGRRGAFRLVGGRAALRELIGEHLDSGETRPHSASRILLKGNRVVGVEAGPRSEPFGANYVIYAGSLSHLPALLESEDGPPKQLVKTMAGARVIGYRYVLNAVLTSAGIPEGIASLSYACADPEKQLFGTNAIALNVGDPDEEGHVVVSVICVLPIPQNGDEGPVTVDPLEFARVARPAVEARLAELMPYWEGHRVLLHSPHDGVAPLGLTIEPPGPVPMEEVYAGDATPLGVGLVTHGGLLKHLVVASRQNLPGLGIEGELAAAWSAARVIAVAERKKDTLRSEQLLTRA